MQALFPASSMLHTFNDLGSQRYPPAGLRDRLLDTAFAWVEGVDDDSLYESLSVEELAAVSGRRNAPPHYCRSKCWRPSTPRARRVSAASSAWRHSCRPLCGWRRRLRSGSKGKSVLNEISFFLYQTWIDTTLTYTGANVAVES